MNGVDVELWVRYRASHAESIEQRHAEFMASMAKIGPPLGFAGLALPPAPDCKDQLAVVYGVKLSTRGLKFVGHYKYRGERYVYLDRGSFDDGIRFGFKTSNKVVEYRAVLHEHFPIIVEAYRGYKAFVEFGLYSSGYWSGSETEEIPVGKDGYFIEKNPVYNRLRADPAIDLDGRNNIFTLTPAMYWDAELCRRALGYGPEEVIARLAGEVPKVQRLMDGVYVVFNDDPGLTYPEFVEMNNRYKAILGLA